MKGKRVLALTSFALGIAIIARLVNNYFRWQQKVLQYLQSNSSIMDTTAGTIEYSVKGEGPAILFSHGSPGGYDQSLATANMFKSDHFTYIAVSRPGYLRTPLHHKSPAAQADLFAALLDRLGIQKATIIGTSGGGPSALQFALRHPERCSALIMVCGVSQRYSEQEMLATLPPIRRLVTFLLERFVYSSNPPLFLFEKALGRFPYPLVPEGLLQSLTMRRLRKAGYDNDMEQFARIGDYPLEQITAPTLVLHGDRDRDVSIKDAELVVSKVPHAKFVIDKGGDHLFLFKHRKKIVPLILDFLALLPEYEKQARL
ncbi:MAG: alpha/beta hydrolase [Ktedonobacteraceae bacterium]|nr:alpha/beta hydrolase [Ktedonobacteraceae bacterium]